MFGKVLTDDQREHWSNLLEDVSKVRRYDAHTESYEAWWGQLYESYRAWCGELEGLLRQVRLTLKRSLSDAEWDALTKKLFIAWEETGVRVTQLEASADHVRKRVNRPSTRESTDALLGKQPRSGPRHIKGPTDS